MLKTSPSFFDAKGLHVEQHFAKSKDGTKIPYFQVCARRTSRSTARNPTLLYGYGGFEISLTPCYSAAIGAAWLERGGVYVVANIRGGGEYGPAWHQAALKAESPARVRRLHRGRRGPGRAQGHHVAEAPRHHGRQQRRPADGRDAHAASRAVRRDRVPGAAARHEALPQAARRRVVDGRVRRSRQARGLGAASRSTRRTRT